MKSEWAILAGALLIAGAILATNHWQMATLSGGGIVSLNRWTGEISACIAKEPDSDAPKGTTLAVCR